MAPVAHTIICASFFFFSAFPVRARHSESPASTLSSLSLPPTSFMSSFTTSMNLFFGLPPGLQLGTSIYYRSANILLSLLCTCPNHPSLAFLTLNSKPYNIAGLTTVLYTFPFILADTILSHITPFPHSVLLWTVDTKYFACFSSASCNLTVSLGSLSLAHMNSVS